MNRTLEGATAVVIGAAGSVGSAVAAALARDGAVVYCAGRRQAPLQELVARIAGSGGRAHAVECDAYDELAVSAIFERIVAEAGGLDVVVNLVSPALAVSDEVTPSLAMGLDSFRASLTSRALTQFITARAAARHMIPAGRGTIVLVSATPARGVAPMIVGDSAGFGAVESMSRCLAREWAPHGVRVVCVRSGGMPETPRIQQVWRTMADHVGAPAEAIEAASRSMTLTGQMASVEDTANVIAFLASQQARTLVGAIVNSSHGEVID